MQKRMASADKDKQAYVLDSLKAAGKTVRA
jgi:hypothetical protein